MIGGRTNLFDFETSKVTGLITECKINLGAFVCSMECERCVTGQLRAHIAIDEFKVMFLDYVQQAFSMTVHYNVRVRLVL